MNHFKRKIYLSLISTTMLYHTDAFASKDLLETYSTSYLTMHASHAVQQKYGKDETFALGPVVATVSPIMFNSQGNLLENAIEGLVTGVSMVGGAAAVAVYRSQQYCYVLPQEAVGSELTRQAVALGAVVGRGTAKAAIKGVKNIYGWASYLWGNEPAAIVEKNIAVEAPQSTINSGDLEDFLAELKGQQEVAPTLVAPAPVVIYDEETVPSIESFQDAQVYTLEEGEYSSDQESCGGSYGENSDDDLNDREVLKETTLLKVSTAYDRKRANAGSKKVLFDQVALSDKSFESFNGYGAFTYNPIKLNVHCTFNAAREVMDNMPLQEKINTANSRKERIYRASLEITTPYAQMEEYSLEAQILDQEITALENNLAK